MTNSDVNQARDSVEPDDLHVPYSKGDWLETTGDAHLQIAQVRKAYWYRNSSGEVKLYADLWIYNYNGDRIGRESPALDGPRTYEPHCDLEEFQRIQEPEFPIGLHRYDTSETSYTYRYQTKAKVLGPRKPRKKTKVHQPIAKVVIVESTNNFDPQAEARALRIAAENLRDAARSLSTEARAPVIEKAENLERQAAALLAPAD
jgi:hypothetical protein